MEQREIVFVDGMRTGFGRMGGSLKDLHATDLAAITIRALVEKTDVLRRGTVDSLFCGTALGDGQASDPARYAGLAAGLPVSATASYVEMQCGSAIDSINHAAWKMLAGEAEVIIAGGMESYSQLAVKFSTSNMPYRAVPPMPITLKLAPTADQDISMIEVSDLMAQKWGITRQECDEFALCSQQRASAAIAQGYFKEEIVPVPVRDHKKAPERLFSSDEHVRPGTTLSDLQKLKAVRGPDGLTTAGNASGRNDGAAFVLMMTAAKARELGYEPYARWVCGADWGVEPRFMGIGPAYSNLLALKRAGLKVGDLDVIECNEAFAAQNLSVIKEMEAQSGERIDQNIWNPNGGAIAFGHPNAASGARICLAAMKELERRGGHYGLFSSCCGGGQGVTAIIENLRR